MATATFKAPANLTPGTHTFQLVDLDTGVLGNIVTVHVGEAVTLNSPDAQEAGNSFSITGSIAYPPSSPSIQLLLGGTALSGTATLSGSTFSYLVPGQSAGTVSIQAKDTSTGVTSNTVSVAIAGAQQTPVVTFAGTPTSGTANSALSGGTWSETNGTAPWFQLWNGTAFVGSAVQGSGASGSVPSLTPPAAGTYYIIALTAQTGGQNIGSSAAITVAAQAGAGGGTTATVQGGGYFFGGAIIGPVGSRTGKLSNTPTGTVMAGQPLSPPGNFTVSGVPAFGNTCYIGLYNKTLGIYEYFHTGYNLLYPLQAYTITSGQINAPNPNTGALEPLRPSLYNGGGPYTIRLCSDVNGLYVLDESPVFNVQIPAIGATTSAYPNTAAGAGGMGTVMTVGPGKQYATVTNAIEAIINDQKVNGANSQTYWDAVILVDPVSSNDNYYLNDCASNTCASSTPFAYGDTHYVFNKGEMPNVPLTIRGNLAVNGQMPHFKWDGSVNEKGFWLRGANYYSPTGSRQGYPLTLENLHLTGDGTPTTSAGHSSQYESYNFPTIGMQDALEGDLIINNCLIDYWPEVVVGGNVGAGLYIRNTTVQYCGGSGGGASVHTIYIGELSEAIFTDCKFQLPGVNANGHHIKSRAFRTQCIRCAIQDGTSGVGTSFVVDFPQGGDALIDSCVLHHGPGATNVIMIDHGEETPQTSNPGQPVTSTGNNGFPYFHPGRLKIVNSALLNEVPSNSSYGNFPGVITTNLEVGQYELAPWAEMSGNLIYGMDHTNTYFRNFSGPAPEPYQPPDLSMQALSSMPTLDFSPAPATGQLNALAGISGSGSYVSQAATGGTITPPNGAAQLSFCTFGVALTGGNVAFLSLSVGGQEEWGRTPVDNSGVGFVRFPVDSGTYTAQLYNAITGGSAIGSPVTFTVAAASPQPIAAPGNLHATAVYGQLLQVKCSVVSGKNNVYYQLGYRTGGGAWQTTFGIPNADGQTVDFLLTGLTPNTSYEIAVAAMDDYGSGVQSASIMASTPSGTQNVQNHGPYTFSAFTWDNSPQGVYGDNNVNFRGDCGKVSGTISDGSGHAPAAAFFVWSSSPNDPSINPFNEAPQTLSYYSATGYYNNDIAAGPTGGTQYYPWVLTSDGYCFTDGSHYSFS